MSHASEDTLSLLRAGKLLGSTRLDLSCGIVDFPREILELSDSLEILNLSGNRLSELPEDFSRLGKLRILFCSQNEFNHLPAVLGGCENLTMVAFKSNRIEMVEPAALSGSLQWLILTDNRIKSLPPSIGRCPRLRKLMLAGNRLSGLPPEMAACRELELIRLAANGFTEFPDWLFELPRLSWLGLGGNPWSEMPGRSEQPIPEMDWADLELGPRLGEGASGVIHQARLHVEPECRAVAVKIFKGDVTSDGLPETEMDACLAAGQHENLIEVLGKISNHPHGSAALVMSLIGSGFSALAAPPDLQSCTRDVYSDDLAFTPAAVLRMAAGLARAGRHLHERGILHGDFYAHNILWNGQGDCLLGDFGAACRHPGDGRVEPIEVSAFGILLGELLSRCPAVEEESLLMDRLWNLQRQCVGEEISQRPSFARIGDELGHWPDSPPVSWGGV